MCKTLQMNELPSSVKENMSSVSPMVGSVRAFTRPYTLARAYHGHPTGRICALTALPTRTQPTRAVLLLVPVNACMTSCTAASCSPLLSLASRRSISSLRPHHQRLSRPRSSSSSSSSSPPPSSTSPPLVPSQNDSHDAASNVDVENTIQVASEPVIDVCRTCLIARCQSRVDGIKSPVIPDVTVNIRSLLVRTLTVRLKPSLCKWSRNM